MPEGEDWVSFDDDEEEEPTAALPKGLLPPPPDPAEGAESYLARMEGRLSAIRERSQPAVTRVASPRLGAAAVRADDFNPRGTASDPAPASTPDDPDPDAAESTAGSSGSWCRRCCCCCGRGRRDARADALAEFDPLPAASESDEPDGQRQYARLLEVSAEEGLELSDDGGGDTAP